MILVDRSAAELLRVVASFDLPNNFAWLPHHRVLPNGAPSGLLTFCSAAIHGLTSALHCAVPIRSNELGDVEKYGLANLQHDWLVGPMGKAASWSIVDAETARQRAATGFPTVATWKNPTNGHGHIALVVPNAADPGHLYVAGAGAKNTSCTRIENSFGLNLHPAFTTHD